MRFFATGNLIISLTDVVGISVASRSRIVKLVSNAIATLWLDFIKMPGNVEELQKTALDFLILIAHFT